MGCGASAQKPPDSVPAPTASVPTAAGPSDGSGPPVGTNTQTGAILLHSAKKLRNEDWLLTGTSDPYVVCRLGPVGSSWKSKTRVNEAHSDTVYGDLNPVWRLAFPYAIPADQKLETWELQLRIYDKDLASSDDFLGELRVGMFILLANWNMLTQYPLPGSHSSVLIMLGSKVSDALHEEMMMAKNLERANGWFSTWVRASKKLGQWFNDALSTPLYWANMVRMARAWSAIISNDSDKSYEWFRRRATVSDTGVHSYKWNGPEIERSVTLMGHAECSERLQKLGEALGTNNGDAKAFKPNFLGMQQLNPLFWPEVPWHGIGLSIPQETHAWIRPLLTKLSGPGGNWSSQWITDEASKFLSGRESIIVTDDLRMWGTQILHQVFLGLKLTEQEASEFMAWQKKILVIIGAPELAVKAPGLDSVFDLDGCVEFKLGCLERYKPLLKKQLPKETAEFSDADMTALATAVMDALLFAGGQSVPSVIAYALALPYSEYGQTNLPKGFSLDNPSTLVVYIWEVMRRFPPVSGFVIQERSFGTKEDERVYLQLQMAQQDPRVWGGADSTRFIMRPISEYHTKSVGFAEPSIAPRLESPNSHSCPAKDLAFSMALNFIREFARTGSNVEGGYSRLWRAHDPEDKARTLLKPEDITLNLFGTTRFTLHKDASAQGPTEEASSGAHLLEMLSPEERKLMRSSVHIKNKMDNVDNYTKVFTQVVRMVVKPGSEDTSTNVGPPLQQDFSPDDFSTEPVGGLRFLLNSDEDEQPSRLAALGKLAVFGALSTAENVGLVQVNDDPLTWFDSYEEAVVCMDHMFGQYLPPQFNVWEDMASDDGMRSLCLFGVAAWYLAPLKNSAEVGHEVPQGAAFECNLEYMSKYTTRKNWITYGHTLYLAAPKDGDTLPGNVVGIWSCHHNKLLVPGDSLWEHGKAAFRSSLCTSVTCRDHLAWTHWIIGNGLMLSARQCLNKDHPLRRLLKQFYYGTAAINENSRAILLPLDRLAHKTFAFTDDGWISFFNDVCGAWKWVPFPERMKQTGLSAEVLGALPLSTDGELFWQTIEKYVETYLKIFYPSEGSVSADAELVAFWSSFATHFGTPWQLPELSFPTLVSLVTDLIWWVTGGHELFGSIVEYLTSLSGMMPKLVDGKDVPDVQTFVQTLIIISLTGMKEPPLMDEWTHLFMVPSWEKGQQQAVLDVVRQFQVDLAACSDEIEHRNMMRERQGLKKVVAFDPRIMETSVSI